MSVNIETGDWECMQCSAPVLPEERQSITDMLKVQSQIEFRCDECGDALTADTTDCPEGEVSINSEWVYG